YQIDNTRPATGKGIAYWRTNPALPRNTDPTNFSIKANFADKTTEEEKARFYRAFDLTPDVDWISLTRGMDYLKGTGSASVGLMADLSDKTPGLYIGKVAATRKSEDRLFDAPIHEFDLVLSMIKPYRITPENRGVIHAEGEIEPGFLDRIYVEVPPGITALSMNLRMLNGGQASTVSARVFDPEGVDRGGIGQVSEQRDTESHTLLRGIVPGTWEVVVNSSIRSRAPAKYDLTVTFAGMEFKTPRRFASDSDLTRAELLVPLHSTQPRSFSGTVAGRIDGFIKKEVVEVKETDRFERTVLLDNAVSTAMWTLVFDRETYALFTDCVLRVEDSETGKSLVNTGLGQRAEAVSIAVPNGQAEPKEYKLVLLPAFTQEKDYKQWQFTLVEKLTWSAPPAKLELSKPKNNRLHIRPWDWEDLQFHLPANLPTPPAGYKLDLIFDVTSEEPNELILSRHFEW
ncbi:MAG: hypothetical protein KJ645_08705, partial [Planctomycetes bacterium]|nr:hypothetical protein [Planctomycetota bacterium]